MRVLDSVVGLRRKGDEKALLKCRPDDVARMYCITGTPMLELGNT